MRGHSRYSKKNVLLLRSAALILPLAFALALLSQTAFATTYVITDGDRVFTYTTFATDPGEVLGQAGLHLDTDDTYTAEPAGNGTSAITIRRASSVTVSYHGETTEVSCSGETVAELLAGLNLEVGAEDVLSHAMGEVTYDGMELRVDKVIRQQQTYTATVAHETTRCSDSSLPEGMEEVLIRGVDGELLCTADVTYVNGVEASRTVLSEKLTVAPVTEIIAEGTGNAASGVDPDAMPVIGDGYIILPTGEVLTYTGTAQVRATAYTHTDAGCDLITATGTTVHKGTVAVDPRYIPYGTRMFIVANDGSYIYGVSEAEDCGGAIKGDRVDLYFPTYNECIQFGWRNCTIYFLG